MSGARTTRWCCRPPCIRTHVHTHASTHAHAHAHVHTHTHTHAHIMHATRTHTHAHTHTHTLHTRAHAPSESPSSYTVPSFQPPGVPSVPPPPPAAPLWQHHGNMRTTRQQHGNSMVTPRVFNGEEAYGCTGTATQQAAATTHEARAASHRHMAAPQAPQTPHAQAPQAPHSKAPHHAGTAHRRYTSRGVEPRGVCTHATPVHAIAVCRWCDLVGGATHQVGGGEWVVAVVGGGGGWRT